MPKNFHINLIIRILRKNNMKQDWEYGILDDAVKKGSSNISLNKIKDEEGDYPVYGAKGFDIGFVEYFLNGIDFEKHRNGSTIPHIYFKDYKTERFPILPLPEQQRIVSILNKAFASIAKAKANAEQNLKNSKELFESTKKNVFESLERVANNVSLPFICDKIFAGGDVPKDNFSKTKTDKYQIPIIANAVKDNGLYGFTDKIRVLKPSLTIAARGSGTGHTEIRNEPFFPIVRLIVLTPNIELICLEFLKYSIQNLEILRSGSAIPQLTVPMIKGYLIPLPTLEEQNIIVERLDILSTETKNLEAIYQQKIVDLEELKKSVLQKAFNGKL